MICWHNNYSNIHINYLRYQLENHKNMDNHYKSEIEYLIYFLYYRKMKTINENYNQNIFKLQR